jgi:hypothetical protein
MFAKAGHALGFRRGPSRGPGVPDEGGVNPFRK